MAASERFINVGTNQPLALTQATNSGFGASGANHSVGLVPDPGSSSGTTRYLREDGTWNVPFTGQVVDVGIIIDGGGAAILTGQKGQVHIPFPLTITAWRVMADQSGSIVIDVLRAHDAVPSASIVGSGNMPTLSSAQFNEVVTSGWTSVALVADDWIAFNVTSATTVTRVTIVLACTRA